MKKTPQSEQKPSAEVAALLEQWAKEDRAENRQRLKRQPLTANGAVLNGERVLVKLG